MMRMTTLHAAALILSGGCLTEVGLTPDVGELAIPSCVPDDSDPAREVLYTMDVVPIFRTRCTPCHDPDSSSPLGFMETGFSINSYGELRRGGSSSGTDIVIDGDPCSSVLVQKTGPAPPFGSRMPRQRSPLTLAERRTIADWIAEGARAN